MTRTPTRRSKRYGAVVSTVQMRRPPGPPTDYRRGRHPFAPPVSAEQLFLQYPHLGGEQDLSLQAVQTDHQLGLGLSGTAVGSSDAAAADPDPARLGD